MQSIVGFSDNPLTESPANVDPVTMSGVRVSRAGAAGALILGLVAVALALVGIRRWGRIQTWVVAVPVLLAIGIALAETVVILMPNLY